MVQSHTEQAASGLRSPTRSATETVQALLDRIAQLETALKHAEEALFWHDGMEFEMDGKTAEEAINGALRP